MSSAPVRGLYQDILQRFDKVRVRENRISFLTGLEIATVSAVGILLCGIVLEEVLHIGPMGRTLLLLFMVVGIFVSWLWFLGRPILRMAGILQSIDNHSIARLVGSHFPSVRDRLLDALQMYEQKEALHEHYSPELIDASFGDLHAQMRSLDFSAAIVTTRFRRLRKYLTYAFTVAALVLVISPSGFFESLYRITHYQQSFAATIPIRFIIDPGDTHAVRGQNVSVTVRTEGKNIGSISFLSRQEGQIDFDTRVLKGQGGIFYAAFNDIKSTTEYYASAEDVQSDHYKITVYDRPLTRSFQLRLIPPSYTHLPVTNADDNVGDMSVYAGTRVGVQLSANKDLSESRIVFSDSSSILLNTSGPRASGTFVARKYATYHFSLKDKDGLQNLDPVDYTITIVPDEYPTVEIVNPGKDIDLTETMNVSLLIRLRDDFGFSKLRLAWRLAQSKYEKPAEEFSYIDLPLQPHQTSPAEIIYNWDLTPMHLVPEDAVAYYAEVFDNDDVNGPKSGRSQTYTLRLPSLEEVFSDVSQSHEQSLESMQNASKESEQLRRDIEDLKRDLAKNNQKADWQQQKKAEELVQRYEAVRKKLEDASQRLDETMKQMEDNKLVSDKTLEKYEELQKLMDQLKSPELQEALKKLQESMKQLSPDQMKQAMDQLKISEEQFRQSLERTIELLKRIHIEQKVDELIKRAEELRKQQEAVRYQTGQSQSSNKEERDKLAEQERDLSAKADSLNKEASSLQKKMEEFPKEMPVDQMQKAAKQLEQHAVDKKMDQASKQMESGEMNGAQEQQQQSEQALNEFQQQMQQVQQSLQENQMKQVVNELRKQLENVVELSKQEEQLKEETKSLDPTSRRFREDAQKQDDIQSGLKSVNDKLGELGKKTFAVSPEMSKELGNAMRSMNEAMQMMEGRNPGASSARQGEAMSSLNRAAVMMQSTLSSMMQAGRGGNMGMAGLMARLGQLSGMQGGINQQTKEAMGNGEGQGLTMEQQQAYGRLAGQQAGVQKSLKELAEEAKNAGDFSKLLGDLDDVAKQMQEVQTDLEQNNVNPNTIQKQDRILSRLLDSQRSMRERDYEKRRQAQTGKELQHASPSELDLSTQEGKNKLREELLKVLEGKYSKDYESLIKKYFEQLDKQQVNNQ